MSEAAAEKLKSVTRDGLGRPPIEDSIPQLHETIVKISSSLAGADGKRRTDILEACHTLDDLCAALLKEGYNLSRSTLYYRLAPRKSNSTEGKKHVRTVPVKIRRAKNNIRARHQEPSPPTELWLSTHVLTSQYFLQIIKCDDLACCGKMRSAWKTVFPKRFLPSPAVLQKSEEGPVVPKPSMVKSTDRYADLWQRLVLTAM